MRMAKVATGALAALLAALASPGAAAASALAHTVVRTTPHTRPLSSTRHIRAARARVHAAGTGAVQPAADGDGEDEEQRMRLERGREKMEEILEHKEAISPELSATQRLIQQLFPSSQFVGQGKLPAKFIFVDEVTCIGCTHCRFVAPNTFMLEDDFGRARVFNQGGDDDEKINEAIECCPVECIHQVSHTELVRLEEYRSDQLGKIQAKYWKSRLVGPEIGIPNVPNWWEPLMDSAQPAWAGMITGEQSMSSLGFLDPPPQEKVELDMWGNPIPKDAEAEAAAAEAAAQAEAESLAAAAAEAAAEAAEAAMEEAEELTCVADGVDGFEPCEVDDAGVIDLVDLGRLEPETAEMAHKLEKLFALDQTSTGLPFEGTAEERQLSAESQRDEDDDEQDERRKMP